MDYFPAARLAEVHRVDKRIFCMKDVLNDTNDPGMIDRQYRVHNCTITLSAQQMSSIILQTYHQFSHDESDDNMCDNDRPLCSSDR